MSSQHDEFEIRQLLNKDSFALFNLEVSFKIDRHLLRDRYRELQKKYHPDNFVVASHGLKSVALQLSANINSGYLALSAPFSRVFAVLNHYGINFDLTHDTYFPEDFLYEQLNLQESIEDAHLANRAEELENTILELESKISEILNQLELLLIERKSQFQKFILNDKIKLQIKKMAFYSKISDRLGEMLD